MKKEIFFTLLILAVTVGLSATDYLVVHKNNATTSSFNRSTIDSIKFTSDQTVLSIYQDASSTDYALSDIDSITFSSEDETTIKIVYNGTSVTVTNPYEDNGVSISTSGADVTVTSTISDTKLTYLVSGTTTDGFLKIYSSYKYNLELNGVSITNSDGPAINIQSGKKCDLVLVDGTTSSLTDGSSYASSDKDQKATLFSEGQLVFSGTGTLNVTGNYKHGICSDDYISVESGTINVLSAPKDAIHVSNYFEMLDGTVTLLSSSDGLDCEGYVDISGGTLGFTSSTTDIKGINSDSTLTISGGTINLTMNGDQSKAMASDYDMNLSGGTFTINTSGDAVLESSGSGYDPSYCTAIKGKSDVNISGGTFTITTSGMGGKGISSDGDINISGGSVSVTTTGDGAKYTDSDGATDAYTATCLTADADISITTTGTVTLSSSGLAGKGISADGSLTVGDSTNSPTLNITTSGDEISGTTSSSGGAPGSSTSTTTSYASPKAIKADVDVVINNGTIAISSTDDGIKSESSLTVNGGNITVSKSYEALESLIINMNGGYVNLTASDDAVNATEGTTSGGTETTDNSYFYMNGGTLIANSTNGDAIDANGRFVMTDGNLIAFGPANSTNEDLDVNGTITVNGGTFFGACYNSSMFETSISSSGQVGAILKSSSSVASAGSYFNIQDASGNSIATFITPRVAYYFHFCSPSLVKSSKYYIYTGGSYSGGTTYGSTTTGAFCTDGTYSAGTQKKTFTTGSSTISSITM